MLQKSTVKYIQSLQYKKERDISARFVAEGTKVIEELITSNVFRCTQLFATAEWIDQMDEFIRKNQFLSDITIINEVDLKRISGQKTPQKVLGIFQKKEMIYPQEFSGLTLLLDDMQDPGNLGTIIRSADWFGVSTIICSPQTVDMYNPKVVQSTMASLANVNIYYKDLLSFLKQHPQIPVYAAMLQGEDPSLLHKQKNAFLIIGNESRGVSSELTSRCSASISIPRIGKAESLNASIAASILMYAYRKD